MTPEQEEKFNRMREALSQEEPSMGHLSDNHVMRYLNAFQWDHDSVLANIKRAEEMRTDLDCQVLRE